VISYLLGGFLMGTETGTGIRMLLLGVYGMEVVECGGALAINAEFSAQHYIDTIGIEGLEEIYPSFSSLATHYEQGRAIRKIEDQAVHVYHGLATHGHFSLAEPYRREGNFHLQTLIK
jgi:hypothetical protein